MTGELSVSYMGVGIKGGGGGGGGAGVPAPTFQLSLCIKAYTEYGCG